MTVNLMTIPPTQMTTQAPLSMKVTTAPTQQTTGLLTTVPPLNRLQKYEERLIMNIMKFILKMYYRIKFRFGYRREEKLVNSFEGWYIHIG